MGKGACTGRVLAIDYGKKRVGLAMSDPLRILATPYGYLPRRYHQDPEGVELIARLLELIREYAVTTVVVGEPKRTDGREHLWLEEVRRFAKALKDASALPVVLLDERYTTVLADRTLVLQNKGKQRKEEIDARAAAILLEDYLKR